jgi:hypothetical protein
VACEPTCLLNFYYEHIYVNLCVHDIVLMHSDPIHDIVVMQISISSSNDEDQTLELLLDHWKAK